MNLYIYIYIREGFREEGELVGVTAIGYSPSSHMVWCSSEKGGLQVSKCIYIYIIEINLNIFIHIRMRFREREEEGELVGVTAIGYSPSSHMVWCSSEKGVLHIYIDIYI